MQSQYRQSTLKLGDGVKLTPSKSGTKLKVVSSGVERVYGWPTIANVYHAHAYISREKEKERKEEREREREGETQRERERERERERHRER